ncbi:MAG: tRNA pseudouridine(13) synthase TruD [Nannocystaceae bacterium]
MPLTDEQLQPLLAPPLSTAGLPGVGGVIRQRCEDFYVCELPAYGPDGREQAHLLVTLKKRDLGSSEALDLVADHCGLPRREFGLAGLKDKRAVTEQWVTAPWAAREALASFSHPQVSLGPASAHGNKLRRGHLRGNRFVIVVRDLAVSPSEAAIRVEQKFAALKAAGGLDNLYAQQRFGRTGHNAIRGVELLANPKRGRRRGKADFVLSAGQSALFNFYLLARREQGLLRTVLAGDVLKKTATGGLFTCSDPEADQPRLDAGEVVITGPMFGGKMPVPSAGSPADELECAILGAYGLDREGLKAFGKKLPGTRRRLQISLEHERVAALPNGGDSGANRFPDGVPDPGDEPGLVLQWVLPPGTYATQVLRELMGPTTESSIAAGAA